MKQTMQKIVIQSSDFPVRRIPARTVTKKHYSRYFPYCC